MAEIKLTTEQQKVVDTRNCNLLVAAAAGSGKTAVLVKRIIKKVADEGQDIDRLLIVTFTNAAASEMRERIGAAIEEALEQNLENTHLQRQMLLLHNAQITTIHSFCLSVIREFFHVLHLDPGFRIGDEAELSLMKSDVLEEVLEECYEKEDEAFVSFVESYGSAKSDEQVVEYIKKLYDTAMSQLWPEEWLDSLADGFDLTEEEFKRHPMLQQIMREVHSCLSDCLTVVERMIGITEEPEGPFAYRETFLADKEELERLLTAAKDYEAFSAAIAELKFVSLSRKKQEASEEKKTLAKNLRDYVKKQMTKLRDEFFYASLTELWEETIQMELPMRGLIYVTKEFLARYRKKKEENNLLDFNDLEHMALRILVEKTEEGTRPSAVARTLADRYDEIMIDEYQDSNLIQEAVLTSISGEWTGQPNVFMVGDVKQSIYRFRMACPALFMEKYRTYGEEGKYRKIDLHKNFRSRECILNAINVLFAGLMHEDSTEVEYDAAAALYYGASYPAEQEAHRTEVLFVSMERPSEQPGNENAGGDDSGQSVSDNIWNTGAATAEWDSESNEDGEAASSAKVDGELSQEEQSMVQAEALAVSGRIKELLVSDLRIGSEERPVDYGDIVILLRTMSGWSETFLEVLSEQGIPAYADTGSGYFKTFEIRKTLDFLRILDNPKQDIPFAAVLHSPIAGFNAEELAELRVKYGVIPGEEKKQRCLYAAAREAAKEASDAGLDGVNGKAAGFFKLYDRLRAEADYVSIHELLERFYRYSGFYDAVTVMPGGERRRGNLDMLITKAKQYEATSFSGLYDFIRYIDKLIKYEVDFGEANHGESTRMVRIMSIHKSKGLEFPVVFLCGMEKKFNRQDMRKRLIFHSELGLGPEFVDTKLRIKSPTLLKKSIAKKMNEEMIAEELRVLYVALTRAKEKLIMTGAIKNPEKRYLAWQERSETVGKRGLLSSYVAKAETYYDFICPLLFAGVTVNEESSVTGGVSDIADALENGTELRLEANLQEVTFEGTFFMRGTGWDDRTVAETSEQKTKEEKLLILEQMREMEPGRTAEAVEITALLEQQSSYEYPYGGDASLPVKVTVSELKRLQLEAEETEEVSGTDSALKELTPEEISFEDYVPDVHSVPAESAVPESDSGMVGVDDFSYPEFLLPEKQLSGSDRGTIYHHVMELIPFEEDRTREQIKALLDGMVQAGTLRPEEREIVSDYKLWKFFHSTLGKKMCHAAGKGMLHREQPFVLGLPAKEIYPDTNSSEIVLVQGIIDAFFEEDDGLILMDYKTDYIHNDAKEELTKKYKGQLDYYRKALERLKQKPVKEIWFYSFSKDEDFTVE